MKRFYLFGANISHSFSPRMHNLCFKQLNLPYTYELYENSLQKCKQLTLSEQFGGASITIPYKKSFTENVQYLGHSIELQNINTIVKENKQLKGYNTDYLGIQNSLPLDKITKAYVIGSGATASTILWVLKNNKIPTVVASRSPATELMKLFPNVQFLNLNSWIDSVPEIQSTDIIISSTPPFDHPLPSSTYKNNPYIFDVNYNPKITVFIQRALKNGVAKDKIIYGIEMLINQGLEQNYLFTGQRVRSQTKQELFQLYQQLNK